jgi:hypothetical protein
MKRRPNKFVLAAIGVVHLTVVTLTWRDIRQRPEDQIRGSKTLWRVLSAANTLGSGAYWLAGRPPAHAHLSRPRRGPARPVICGQHPAGGQ